MRTVLFLILCLSLFFSLRSLSFAMTYISIYGYRVKECIERILGQQKACDLLNAVYQFFVMLVSMYFAVEGILLLINKNFVKSFDITFFIAISICYITYFILRLKMETKYNLCNFYNHMIDYRSKQKVVTEDNDNEVSFIKSHEKVMKHKRNMNILYLMSLATLLYVFLQK